MAVDYVKTYGPGWSVRASWRGVTDAEAKVKCTEWSNVIEGRFAALRAARNGQRRTLDHRELHALVGLWYAKYVGEYETKPGDPDGWQQALDDFGETLTQASGPEDGDRAYEDLLADASILATIRDDVARATAADAFLADHGHALSRVSRAAFLDALAPRYADALALLLKRAKGTIAAILSPTRSQRWNPRLKRAYRWSLCSSNGAKRPSLTGTIRRWEPVINVAQAQWPDIRKVTESSAREWLRSLVNEKRSAHTVSTIWRTALKTICNWAIAQGLLTNNPFARVKIVVPRKIATRESKAFTDIEANTILPLHWHTMNLEHCGMRSDGYRGCALIAEREPARLHSYAVKMWRNMTAYGRSRSHPRPARSKTGSRERSRFTSTSSRKAFWIS